MEERRKEKTPKKKREDRQRKKEEKDGGRGVEGREDKGTKTIKAGERNKGKKMKLRKNK